MHTAVARLPRRSLFPPAPALAAGGTDEAEGPTGASIRDGDHRVGAAGARWPTEVLTFIRFATSVLRASDEAGAGVGPGSRQRRTHRGDRRLRPTSRRR